jgi:hypothetical protein
MLPLRTSPRRTRQPPATVRAVLSGPRKPSNGVLYRSMAQSGRNFSRKTKTNVGGFAGVRTDPKPASDRPDPPKPLLPLARVLAGADCPHSCYSRARRSTLKTAKGGRDLLLPLPLKQRAGRGRRPRRFSSVRGCSMPETRDWTGRDGYLPRPFNAAVHPYAGITQARRPRNQLWGRALMHPDTSPHRRHTRLTPHHNTSPSPSSFLALHPP